MAVIRRKVSRTDKTLSTLQVIVFGSLILYFGKTVLIPLSFALLISFILYPICAWLESRSMRRMTAILISTLLLLLLFMGIIALLVHQVFSFLSEWPAIKTKLTEAGEMVSLYLADTFKLSKEQQELMLKQMMDQSGGDLLVIIRQTISAYSFSLVLAILIPVFSTLILYYRSRLVKVLYMIFPIESRADIKKVLSLTITAYYNFIKGMGIVYFVVGTLNSIGLLLLGVPHAILFGFIAAILTFIPYVGIIVGSLLPIAMSWITFNSIWYPIGVVLLFSFVQYLEANLIFPLAVSNRLKINALATLIAIFVGGILWGVAGMILFVPFLAIAKLIADNSVNLRTWSTLLGTSD